MLKPVLAAAQFVAERFATIITACACVALMLATVHVTADVIMTRLFQSPINGTQMIVTTYYMVAMLFMPLAYAESRSGHIKADLFFSPLPYAVRWTVSLLTYVAMSAFLAVMTWQLYLRAARQTRIGEMYLLSDMTVILWPSRWLAVLGVAAFFVVTLLRTLALFTPGGYAKLERARDAD